MNATTVFPIGHYGGHYGRPSESTSGASSRSGDPGDSDEQHLIRVGRRMERLTDDEFGVWMLAHGIAEAGDGSWTRDKICDRAGEAEIAGPVACFDQLLERALLTVVPTGADRLDEATAFATTFRLRNLLVGLGVQPDRPGRYAIGVPGVGTAALLDEGGYRLWQWGAVAPTLWHHCQDRIRSAGNPSATPDPPGRAGLDTLVDPAAVLAEILGELRVLLVHGCAYLDTVSEQPEPPEPSRHSEPSEPRDGGRNDAGARLAAG